MWYSFTLAGWRLWCSAPFDLTVGQESRPFLLEVRETPPAPGEADRVLELCPVEAIPFSAQDGGTWQDNRCYRRRGQVQEVFYCAAPGRPPYAQVTWDLSAPQRLLCRYVAGQEGELYTFRNIFQLLSGETLLLELGGLMLHASFIRWQGRGILFSATSGVGKSTQADLWARCCQAEVLNGDRAALRPGPDGWRAYGLPYAGSSGIYRNEDAPVAAIVLLLIAVASMIIANTIKITVFNRRKEISIMKYVGATDMFIRLPFIVEGLLLGLISATLAFLVIWALYALLCHSLTGSDTVLLAFLTENLVPFGQMALPLIGCFILVGVTIGTLGSIIFVRRYLKV